LNKDYYPYPKRDGIKNFYPMPNEILRLGLCAGEIAVINVLMNRENRQTYECVCSYRTIGEAIDMCENTVAKHVRSLEEKGLIHTEPTTVNRKSDGRRMNGCLKYHIRPIQEAIDIYNERQMLELQRTAAIQKTQAIAAKKGVEFHPPTASEKGGEQIGA